MNEGIVVYSNKGDIIFTSTGEIKVVEKKKIRHHKNVIHQIFENLKKYNIEENKEMNQFLSNASRNIFPKEFKYINGILYKKVYKNKFDLYLNANELEKTYSLLETFIVIRENKIVIIDDDDDKINESFETHELKTSNVKDSDSELLYMYITEKVKNYNLELDESLELESFIKMGLVSDFFNDDNIIIKNNKIQSINYLEFDKKSRHFDISLFTIPKILKKDHKKIVMNEYFMKKFTKFIDHVNKNK